MQEKAIKSRNTVIPRFKAKKPRFMRDVSSCSKAPTLLSGVRRLVFYAAIVLRTFLYVYIQTEQRGPRLANAGRQVE
jgi:hypothetical protein